MTTSYPVRFAAQLKQHLRALRKKRGLTQARLGALIGVSQARIAEIESNPGLVSFEQMLQLLSALGSTLAVQEEDSAAPVQDRPSSVKTAGRKKPGKVGGASTYKFTQTAELARPTTGPDFTFNTPNIPIRSWTMLPIRQDGPASLAASADKKAQPVSRQNVVIRPKKGTW